MGFVNPLLSGLISHQKITGTTPSFRPHRPQPPATPPATSSASPWRSHHAPGFVFTRRHRGGQGTLLKKTWMDLSWMIITWVGTTLPSKSHHQDYEPFLVGDPYKPSFATVTGRGDNPNHNILLMEENPANQLRLVGFHILDKVLAPSQRGAGFLPSTIP